MRITILTVGSRGDVQPYAALGQALAERGHSVRLATHAIFEPLVRQCRLEFFAIEGNPQSILMNQDGQRLQRSRRSTASFMRKAVRAFEPVLAQLADDALRACARAEAIVYTPFTFFGYDLGLHYGVPSIATSLQPAIPTRQFPSPAMPRAVRLGGWFNRLTHSMSEYAFWKVVQPYHNRWRVEELGLPAVKLWKDKDRRNKIVIHGYSPSVLPKPNDWGRRGHVAGFWFCNSDPDWEAPDSLQQFLADGPPPVYVGFGSMPGDDAGQLTGIAIDALAASKQRGIITTG
jgi:UDP:flavonoid glycosyltransferase YjiC (YdhE family)